MLRRHADPNKAVLSCTPPQLECAECGKTTPIHRDLKTDRKPQYVFERLGGMPTANAEGLRRIRGQHRKGLDETRLSLSSAPAPRAFAVVGMHRDFFKKRAADGDGGPGLPDQPRVWTCGQAYRHAYRPVYRRAYRHATRLAPLESSRRGGHFEHRHVLTRTIATAVGDAEMRPKKVRELQGDARERRRADDEQGRVLCVAPRRLYRLYFGIADGMSIARV